MKIWISSRNYKVTVFFLFSSNWSSVENVGAVSAKFWLHYCETKFCQPNSFNFQTKSSRTRPIKSQDRPSFSSKFNAGTQKENLPYFEIFTGNEFSLVVADDFRKGAVSVLWWAAADVDVAGLLPMIMWNKPRRNLIFRVANAARKTCSFVSAHREHVFSMHLTQGTRKM